MANEVYIAPGSTTKFASAGDVVFTPTSIASGAMRISAEATLGTTFTTARADEYHWSAQTKWLDTLEVGETLDIYIAEADSDGDYDGTLTAGDATLSESTDVLKNLNYVGSIIATTATEQIERTSGVVRIKSNKCVVVFHNNATPALSASAGDHEFALTPIPYQSQS